MNAGFSKGLFMLVALSATTAFANNGGGQHNNNNDNDNDNDNEIPFSEAELFFELNHTDSDLGLHGNIDGDAWRFIRVFDPSERKMLSVTAMGRLGRQGMTQLNFESDEPTFDELPPPALFQRFPEGVYEIEGLSLEGEEMESEARISHVMPAPPGNIHISGVPAAEDCDAENLPTVDEDDVRVSWDPVVISHPDLGKEGEIEIANYEFIAEIRGTDFSFKMTLPPSITSVEIPEDFIELSREFKFEILARDVNLNRTAIESCFLVE